MCAKNRRLISIIFILILGGLASLAFIEGLQVSAAPLTQDPQPTPTIEYFTLLPLRTITDTTIPEFQTEPNAIESPQMETPDGVSLPEPGIEDLSTEIEWQDPLADQESIENIPAANPALETEQSELEMLAQMAATTDGPHYMTPFEPLAVQGAILVKTYVSSEKIRPNSEIIFTVQYTNTTSSQVTDVTIEDNVSAGMDFLQATPNTNFSVGDGSSSASGWALKWTSITIPAGGHGTLTIRCVTGPAEPNETKPITLLGNTVRLIASGQSDSTHQVQSTLVGPIFHVTKSAPVGVYPGHLIEYAITVQNIARNDSWPATNLVISDVIPTSTSIYGGYGHDLVSVGGYFDTGATPPRVMWSIPGPLNPGVSQVVTFTVRLDPGKVTGQAAPNPKANFGAKSAELLLQDVDGFANFDVRALALLQKSATAKRTINNTPAAYHGEEITYTITVNNPLDSAISNVEVIDTLPGNPSPFTFKRMVSGLGNPQILENGRKLKWIVPTLPAWGSASWTFVVQVPKTTYIDDNQNRKEYKNTLSATHPNATFTTETQTAPVLVLAPVTMEKTVLPSHGLPGTNAHYTITLTNASPYPIAQIRLTDTLPTYFDYYEMNVGPNPVYVNSDKNVVAWSGLSVPAGASVKLIFGVKINGDWLFSYTNSLAAYSPDCYIPNRLNLAAVRIDSPLGLNKFVNPSRIAVGQYASYDIHLINQSLENWTLSEVEDTFDTGFNPNPATIKLSTPEVLTPGEEWIGTLQTYADPALIACQDLPKTYPNRKGRVAVHVTSPIDTWGVNAVDLAPLEVTPNLLVDLIPYRKAVLPGGTFVYTLVISNVSSLDGSGNTFELTLPAEFTVSDADFQTTPHPTISGKKMTWSGISIPAGTGWRSIFTVHVSSGSSYGTKKPTAWSATTPGLCAGKLGTAYHKLGKGEVEVVDQIVTLQKKTITQYVPPLSLTDYELTIRNRDSYPFIVDVITDTMPANFTYHTVLNGIQPSTSNNLLIWRNVTLNADKSAVWKLRLQSSPLYAENLWNYLDAYSPYTPIKQAKADKFVSVRPLFKVEKTSITSPVGPGTIIPYTITLTNLSDQIYENIRITDTLPTGFAFSRMVSGAPPITSGINNAQPVWSGLSVNKNCGTSGCKMLLIFEVRIGFNVLPGTYPSMIIGYSTTGSIPGPISAAPVVVNGGMPMIPQFLPSITMQKTP